MAEELTFALTVLAERGEPRGAVPVMEAARLDAEALRSTPRLSWRTGPALAFATAAAVAIVIGAIILVARPPWVDEAPVITVPPEPPVTTTVQEARVEPGRIDDIWDLSTGPDGSLWAATAAGVVRWDLDSGTPLAFGQTDGLPAGDVTAVAVGPEGTVWVAGDSWVARYDGEWRAWDEEAAGLDSPIGDIAVGPDGILWIADGGDALVRFDGGDWTRITTPTGWTTPWTGSLAVAPDGTVWGSLNGEAAVLSFDGEWRRHPLPGPDGNVSIGPDGTVWVGGDGMYGDPDGDTPPAGIARFDGIAWTTFTIADGLLANGAGVAAGPDGTVWAIHTALPPEIADRLGVVEVEGISHFDGSTWTTYPPVGGRGRGAVVTSGGTLWLPSGSGIIGFDGTTVTRLVAGVDAEPPPPPPEPPASPVTLEPADAFEPVQLSTSIGEIEFTTYRPAENLGDLNRMTPTPHGVVVVAGTPFRLAWSADGRTWQETPISVDVNDLTVDGDGLIAYGYDGAVRLRWDGTTWVEDRRIDLDRADQLVAGPGGIVAVDGMQVLFSTDGETFLAATRPPERGELPDVEGEGACSPGSGSSGIMPEMGPVVATESGFVALTPRHPSDWTRTPACEPLVWLSTDGDTWELATEQSPFEDGSYVTHVAVHDGELVASGGRSAEGAVWSSVDGAAWERADLGVARTLRVGAGPGGLILLGTADSLSSKSMWFSAGGSVWDGPYPRPAAWGESWGLIQVAVLDDQIVGSGWADDPETGAWAGFVVVGEIIDTD